MLKITDEEKEIMAWASDAFKKPWFSLCDVLQKIHNGEKLSGTEAKIDPFFVPFKIDGRLIYHFLKHGATRSILGSNASMFTLVTNTRGNKLIWAGIELEDNGVFTEYYLLNDRLEEDWAKKASEMIFNDELENAYEYLCEWIKEQEKLSHIDLGIVKVANIQFFGEFKKAYEEAEEGNKLFLMGLKMSDSVNKILEENWIKFYPNINLKKLLDALSPILKILNPANSKVQEVLSKLPF